MCHNHPQQTGGIFKVMHTHRCHISTSRFLAHARTPSIATTHRTSLGPQAEIWSLIPSSRNLDHRAGKIASGERGVFQISYHPAPSSTMSNGPRKMHKTISLLQLRGTIRSKCRRGTNSLKIERKEKSIEHRVSRQIRPLAAIASGVRHRMATGLRWTRTMRVSKEISIVES